MPKYLPPDDIWAYDKLQFARLVAEAEAAGVFAAEDAGSDDIPRNYAVERMRDSMDMTPAEFATLVDRAQAFWDAHKGPELRVLAEPLTPEEARDRADEHNGIEGVVAVELNAFVDHNLEDVLDLLGEALVDGGSTLSDISYEVVGQQGNTLYVLISGDASGIFDDLGEEEEEEADAEI